MISTLHISRFKSIRDLSLDCKRINVFIGEPNTGKSNILESLGLLSFLYYARFGYADRQFVRFERTSDLFYDGILDRPVDIQCDGISLKLEYKDGKFEGHCSSGQQEPGKFGGDHNSLSATTTDVSAFLNV